MVRVTDMTHGRPIRLILLFSLPLMLGSVFQQLYTIVDTIIIGRGVGMQALASIGAADWINWLVLWGLQGFTQGFAILAAQEFGAGAYDRLRRVLAMIVKLSCWFGIVVTIISLLLVRPLLTLLHTDPAVFGGAQTYLYVQFGGSLIIIAYNMAAAVLRCLGDSRTPLFAIIAASFANIALDLLFVMGFGWGIFGASLRNRTGAADCVSAVSAFSAAAAVRAADKGRLENRPCHSAAPVPPRHSDRSADEHDHTGRHGAAVRAERLRRSVRGGLYGGQQAVRYTRKCISGVWLCHDSLHGAEPRCTKRGTH